MPTPGEHKTVQGRILAYAEAFGWVPVSREEAEEKRGGIPAASGGKVGDRNVPAPFSLFFDALLDANPSLPCGYAGTRVREFNPRYTEAEGALLGLFPPSPRLRRSNRYLRTDIYGNRKFPVRRGLNRSDRKEAFTWSIGPQTAARS